VVNCEAIHRLVVDEERVPAERVTLIRNGIDLEAFDARRGTPLAAPLPDLGGRPSVVLVANMRHEVKRQEDFLHALALARRERPELAGFLVGEGDRTPWLRSLAARLGLDGSTFFLGRRADVPAVLSRATIGVLVSSLEGLSNAVIEGMAAALPMVVTDAGGNGELVKHGERGLVVPVADPEALSRALLDLVRDPARARRLGAAGRSYVEAELTLPRMVSGHERVYQRVVSGRHGLAAALGRAGGAARQVASGGIEFLRERMAGAR
jgi:glycosyltransferase involved in cell wall biosynthesis